MRTRLSERSDSDAAGGRAGPRPARTPGTPGLAAMALGAAALLAACSAPVDPAADLPFPEGWAFSTVQEATRAPGGMVVSADSLASVAGLGILEAGGNATDAAVAVQFALAVVHPRAGNLGGGGFLVLREADGAVASLDFREEAPGAATPEMYLDGEGRVTAESWTGHLASGVPGSVAGMAVAHRRWGSLPWARLLEPAIRLADEGFRMDSSLHRTISRGAERLRRFPASAAVFLPGGEPPPPGATFRQPDLARTLRAIADSGARIFYEGWIADSLVAEMERGGGLISRADLAAYEAVERDPVRVAYRDHGVVSMPPPSSGGIALAQMLRLLEGYDLGARGRGSADATHVMVETMRRAYADRNYYLGDPDVVDIPRDRLTGKRYADSLRATVEMDRASPSGRFNKVRRREPAESPETTHFSIVDSAGNAVAITTTLNGLFGSAVTVRGAGFLLNNEMDDFTANPGVPNAYGLVQGEANAIRPGKRMLSSMSPTLLLGPDGGLEMITGTPGGATIITTVLQLLLDRVDHELGAAAAMHAPRVHHQHLPDRVFYERGGLDTTVVAELRRRGHEVVEREGYQGIAQTIVIAPDGTRLGVSDPRGDGAALGH